MTKPIKVSEKTRERLARLKSSPQEPHDDLLGKLLALVPEGDEEGQYTGAFRVGLLLSRLDMTEGRLTDHREIKRRLGP